MNSNKMLHDCMQMLLFSYKTSRGFSTIINYTRNYVWWELKAFDSNVIIICVCSYMYVYSSKVTHMSRITIISVIHTTQNMTPPTKDAILATTDESIDILVWVRMQSSLQADVITASLPLTGIVNEDTDACWVSLLVSVDAVSSPLSVEKVT